MMYLIGALAPWLFLMAVFAGLMGWALAAARAAPAERALKRDREGVLREVLRMASGDAGQSNAIEAERQTDAMRRQLEMRDGRIVELERALEAARARADSASSDLVAFQRRGDQREADSEELERLRSQIASQRVVEAVPAPPPPTDDENALRDWRLRYFEQRVRYLEEKSVAPQPVAAPEPVSEPSEAPPLMEWRARDAEARAQHLADELRALAAPPAQEEAPDVEAAPFAADAEVDVLLRWRLLYLERRVGYLQQDLRAAEAPAEPAQEAAPALAFDPGPDPDRWKWRARYLESRVRHLEQRAAEAVAAPAPAVAASATPEPQAAAPVQLRAQKPPVLAAARNGAPDDFTLIDGVSLLQQTTLYALGVFHFDQVAAWTPEHVAWVDRYLRLRGRIDEEEWVEQAQNLAREGPAAARRTFESEDA